MAIKGLTTREDITPRFRTLGKLRKGGEKTPKGYGPDLDHFRFTSDDPGIVAAFADVYGAEPHAINVYLPYSTTEQNFPTWKEAWTAGGLQHRCDGETVTIWLGQDGKYHRTPKPCPGGCDEVGRLEVIIPELISSGYVGTVTMETHSLNDMIAITQVLLKAEELSGGDLRRVQFTLRRVPERISVPGWGDNKGKRQRVEKYLVKIEPAVDWAQAQMALTREPGAIAALPTPEDDTPEFNDAQLDADIAHAGEVAARAVQEEPAEATVSLADARKHWSTYWNKMKQRGINPGMLNNAWNVAQIMGRVNAMRTVYDVMKADEETAKADGKEMESAYYADAANSLKTLFEAQA